MRRLGECTWASSRGDTMGRVALEPEDRDTCLLLLGLDPGRDYSIEELVVARDAKVEENCADPSGSASYVEAINDVFESLTGGCETRADATEEHREPGLSENADFSVHKVPSSSVPLPAPMLPVPSPKWPSASQPSRVGPRWYGSAHEESGIWEEASPYRFPSMDYRWPASVPVKRSLVAPTVFWTLCIVVTDLALRAQRDQVALYGFSIALITFGIGGIARYIAVHGARRLRTWLAVVLLIAVGVATVPAAYFVASLPSMIGSVRRRRYGSAIQGGKPTASRYSNRYNSD
jgi:hypothetical protein